MERQRLLEEKLRKEAEEENRRKETQKRAEEAFKKHMMEQEEQKLRAIEERKAKKELLTGGGFDLNKYHASKQLKQEPDDRSSEALTKTGESFLPDINARPSSRRKFNMPTTKHSLGATGFESMRGDRVFKDEPSSTTNLFKSESGQEKESSSKLLKRTREGMSKMGAVTAGGKIMVKRGLSRGRK